MARLPLPGSDDGTWGQVLNDYLTQSHNTDGSLKANSVGGSQISASAVSTASITDDAVTEVKLSASVRTKLNAAGGGGAASPTDLTATTNANTVTVNSSTGTGAVISSATASNAGVLSAADKTKLDGIASGAQVNTVMSVAGRTGTVTLSKNDVGLGNVDNTTDIAKPVSTAVQNALDSKAALTHSHALADMPSGTTITLYGTGATVPVRGTARTDITVLWRTDADPAINAVNGVDIWLRP